MFKKLASFTCWLVLICLSLVFCFTVGLWQQWRTPTILLCWLGILLLTMLLWCSMLALMRIIKEGKGHRWLQKYRLSRREYLLLNHWKAGATVIKHIWRRGTRLPWYLLVGDRCGKSTLLAGAGLPRFYGDTDDEMPGTTRTLRWWFFRDLGILDLSSNFLSDVKNFRQGWRKLARWCTRMPAPSGIVIALSMQDLMRNDLNALHTSIRRQREMIEPLLKRFGARMPLYVIVTQCDHFPGFSLWQQQLSAQQCQQPLGYNWPVSPHIDGQDEQALQPLFTALQQGFSRVRLSMARPASLSESDYATLLDFPEAFAQLEPTLRYVLASLCEPNAWFTHNSLSSVWFCATSPEPENRGRRVSLFVHELLTQHLPTLSQHRAGLRWYHGPRSKTACFLASAACAIWIVVSAWLSAGQLQANIAQQQPEALANFLAQAERRSTTDFRYLPFLPLLNHQYRQVELQLTKINAAPQKNQRGLAVFQQQVLAAAPEQKRDAILQLAKALLIWQQMQDAVPLDTLQRFSPVVDGLKPQRFPDSLSPLATLALERYYMQRPNGERWRQSAQRLLISLVNHDPELGWLITPSRRLPALQAASFWPRLSETTALPGVWTREGQRTVDGWIALIERAAGQPQPVFQQAKSRWQMMRQDAWQHFLIDVTARLMSTGPASMSGSQLIAVAQNKSQSMQFATRALDELSDIPDAQAQPWLMALRHLQQLAINSDKATFMNHAARMDNLMRQTLSTWLRGTAAPITNESALAAAWTQWHTARSNAVKQAVTQSKPSVRLIKGLFAPPKEGANNNPLTDLLPALTTLQEKLSPDNDDAGVEAVWQLYQFDAHRLLANALTQSACWLNEQWKSAVIWPLDQEADLRSYEEQQTLRQQLMSDFFSRSAKQLLAASGNGPVAADYAGITVPLTAEFLRLARQWFSTDMLQDLPQRASTRESDRLAARQAQVEALMEQQAALEKKAIRITVTSLPATVPGGAPLIPTGTQLTLHCQKGEQQLTSMNFAEKAQFTWQPNQCDGVTLDVRFPDFTARYQLDGEDAWPLFVNQLSAGEMLIDSSDFGDSAVLLNQLGIKRVLVRFTLSDSHALAEAWQNWASLTDQINEHQHQIMLLEDRLNQDGAHAYPLSALPGDIAHCQ